MKSITEKNPINNYYEKYGYELGRKMKRDDTPNSRWPPGRANLESPTPVERRRPNSTIFPFTKNTTTPTLGTGASIRRTVTQITVSRILHTRLLWLWVNSVNKWKAHWDDCQRKVVADMWCFYGHVWYGLYVIPPRGATLAGVKII